MIGDKPFLQTSNPRILLFYSQHPTLDFEQVNLFLVHFLEHIGTDLFQPIHSNETGFSLQLTQFMQHHQEQITEMKTSLGDLKSSVTKIQMDITDSLWSQFRNIKQEYVDEFKQIIINTQSNNPILNTLLENNNRQLIEKTTQIIEDIIPKSQCQYNDKIEASIHAFQKSLLEDTHLLLKHNPIIDNNNILNEFINTFEMKSKLMFQNLQQPIYSYISSSEERIHSNLASIKDLSLKTQNNQEKTAKDWKDFIQKSSGNSESNYLDNRNPNESGYQSGTFSSPLHRTQIHIILNRLFPTSEIVKIPRMVLTNSIGTPALTTQIYAVKRPNLPSIMVESKQGETNVDTADIHLFIEQMKSQQMNGIMVSQHSGFMSKPNFFIECHDKFLVVFIHQMEFNMDKLKVAIDIIDQMTAKIKQFHALNPLLEDNGHLHTNEWIEKEVLDEINTEYQLFVSQKNAIILNLREGQRKVISQIEEFQFPSLDKYLSSKYTAPMPKNGHKCDLCKNFNANNLKALAAHKRGCIRKIGQQSQNITNTTNEPEHEEIE